MINVLIIDDEATILENVKFILELENYNVLTASDGEDGIRVFKENLSIIDAIITDMKMPKLSGLDVLKEIKAIMPEMSVIILTGHGDMENAIQSMKQGAYEYLKKPISADSLVISLNNAVSKKRLLMENKRMQQKILEQNEYLQGLHDSAQKILMNLIPKNLPVIPGLRLSSYYKSADIVGGDMYNIKDLGEHVCFYVFDVTSHGILASVITIFIKSYLQNIKNNIMQGVNRKSFAALISDLNVELTANTAQNIFASLFIGFIEKKTKLLRYISAGHIPQFIVNEKEIIPLDSTGTVLGVFEDEQYTCCEQQLSIGDKILLFTDGIVEASRSDEIYGYERLNSVIQNYRSSTITDLNEAILKSVSEYSDSAADDDATLIGIELIAP